MSESLGTIGGAVTVTVQEPVEVTPPVVKPRRNRRSAKAAGAAFERQVADYLATRLDDDRIEPRRSNGVNDRGDITGVKTLQGGRIVIEAKNYSSDRIQIRKWLDEAEVERGNDDALIGVIAVKVRGTAKPEDQLVCMTLETFARLLEGGVDL